MARWSLKLAWFHVKSACGCCVDGGNPLEGLALGGVAMYLALLILIIFSLPRRLLSDSF